MAETRIKYPRTMHLPWSPGVTDDDEVMTDLDCFKGKEVVVTEKMDGECTTLMRGCCYARSVDSRDHESRHWIKAFHGSIRHLIPEGWRICGENLNVVHTIRYESLPTWFIVFSVWDERGVAINWGDTMVMAEDLGVGHVPVLYGGVWDENAVKACWTGRGVYGLLQEGYVVRLEGSFGHGDFGRSVAKFVRRGHVQTDGHWRRRKLEFNGLRLDVGSGP